MELNLYANPTVLPYQSIYKIMIGSIVPRPIGWVSTLDENGNPNLAPFSFFNAVCSNPPTLLFCPSIRSTDSGEKDTLKNVRATGEFVVNIVTEDTAEAMNITATELPTDVNEFELAGLTTAPSVTVKAPRVAESPIHFECEVSHIVEISTEPGGGSVVIGKIRYIHVRDDVALGTDKINLETLKPIGRLAGASYTRVTDLFDMIRRPSEVKKPS